MYIIAFALLILGLVYLSWTRPSFAIAYFILFNNITAIIEENAGLHFSKLIIRYVFFILIIYRSAIKIKIENIKYNRSNIFIVGYMILLLGILYYFFEIDDEYNESRGVFVQNFTLFSLIPSIIGFFVIKTRRDIDDFIKGIIFFGVIFFLTIYFTDAFANVDFTDRMSFEEEGKIDSIELSRLSGLILLTSASLIGNINKKIFTIPIWVLITTALFFLISAAQRGSIIGVGVALLYYGYVYRRKLKPIHIIIAIPVIFLFINIVLNLEVVNVMLDRFADLKNVSDYDRYDDYIKVKDILVKNQYVYGLGPSGYLYKTGREYPHNFFLELTAEYGIIGIAAAILILIGSIQIVIKHTRSKNTKAEIQDVIIPCYLMMLCSVLVSGNIVHNFLFFVFSFLLVRYHHNTAKTKTISFRHHEKNIIPGHLRQN